MSVSLVLSGCGHLDGSEIRECLLTMMTLESLGIGYRCFAPDINYQSVNHLSQATDAGTTRNALIEAARLTRGDIFNIKELHCSESEALIIPGGYGVAKNLSDIALGGSTVIPMLNNLIKEFHLAKKPILGICISPSIITASLAEKGLSPVVTLGKDENGLIAKLGGKHKNCVADDFVCDRECRVLSSPAYMLDKVKIPEVATGIERMISFMKDDPIFTHN